MFALFYSLYWSMFMGRWALATHQDVLNGLKPIVNGLGQFITSIFNDVSTPMTDLGDIIFSTNQYGNPTWINLVAFILALITSIGIVVVATKGIKKLFTVFFYGVR